MAERGIIFSAPMVRALLDGRKTQTRRLIRPELIDGARFAGVERDGSWLFTKGCSYGKVKPPHAIGDRLYVREAWHAARSLDGTAPRNIPRDADIEHAATARSYAEIGLKGRLRPSIHMPRWASRLTLTVTDVRVQRLQDISEHDAIAEGALYATHLPYVGAMSCNQARQAFADLWNSLHDKPGTRWEDNPWLYALTFTVQHRNIDKVQP